MSLPTNIKRMVLASALASAAFVGTSPLATAGPLCDWLFGRTTAPQPYAVGYPVAVQPYAAGYPLSTTYTALPNAPAYPPNYAANYPSNDANAYPGGNYVGSGLPGAAPLQTPAYSSGYGSAIPAQGVGDQGYAMFSPPAGAQFPVAPQPVTSFYGTGNVYPSYQAPGYQAPLVTNPSTIQTHPGPPAGSPGVFGGMSRFFGNLFGNNYQSSYYRAPVTYYRPTTTVDPTTGTTTIVQQPCSSYQEQIQRSPTTSFFGGSTPVTAAPAPCDTATNYYNPYNQPGNAAPIQNVPNYGSTAPYYGPPAAGSGTTNGTGDNINLAPPALEPSPRPIVSPPTTLQLPPPPSTWTAPSGLRSDSNQYDLPSRSSGDTYAGNDRGQRNPNSATNVRPLPAGDYPYPRNRYSAPAEINTSENFPQPGDIPSTARANDNGLQFREPSRDFRNGEGQRVEVDNDDRVALGYKPIDWAVRTAAYESPLSAPVAPPINKVKQPARPVNDYEGYDNSGWTARPRQ